MAGAIAGVVRASAEAERGWEASLTGSGAVVIDPSTAASSLQPLVTGTACLIADGENPAAIDRLRSLHRLDSSLQAIVIADPEARPRVERAILFAPGLGEVWVVGPDEVGPDLVARAAAVTAKRRGYLVTRNRVAQGLSMLEPRPDQRSTVSDAFLAALLEASPDPIVAIDESGLVLSWNPGAERLLGHSAATATGRPLLELLGIGADDPLSDAVRESGSHRSRHDIRFRRSDGSTGEGELLLLPVEAGRRIVRAGILHDLTEERRALARAEHQAAVLEDQATELEAKSGLLEEQGIELEQQVEEAQMLNAELEEVQEHLLETLTARQESEERFRLLFDRSPLPTWLYDVETLRFLEVNQAAVDRYGYTREEFQRLTLRDIRPPEELPRLEQMLAGARAGGVARWTLRHRWRDGTVRDVEVTTGDTSSGGRPSRIAVVLDVTERVEAEAAMRRNEALFRTLAESIPQLAWMARPDGFIFWYNQRWYDYTGTTPEQMAGWGWRTVHHPEWLPRVVERWTESLRTGEPFEMEFPIRGADGAFRAFLTRIVPLRDEAGQVTRWLGTNTDVEGLRRAEREVEQARAVAEARADEAEKAGARLELLAEAGAVLAGSVDTDQALSSLCRLAVSRLGAWCGVYLVDENGALTRHQWAGADPARERIYGELVQRYPPDIGTEGHPIGGVVASGKPLAIPEIPESLLASTARDEDHLRLMRELGLGPVLVVPIAMEQNTLGALALARERGAPDFAADDGALASELARRAAVAIDRARLYDDAMAANRTKTEFLATMSHELRTPLNAMIGYADLLLLGLPEPLGPGATSQVERIERAARHLLSIIEEILTFSRMEVGREIVDPEPVDLAELLREVSAIVEPLADAKSLEFRTEASADSVSLVTDPRKLRQILINLLGNAVKFTERGSIEFTTTAEGDELVFRVRDTGIGLSPENLARVFEPFWQADSSSRRSIGGTGLGLAVSRELAELLGGTLTAESELGRGATFALRLPTRFAGVRGEAPEAA